MVFTYFKRANFAPSEFDAFNFFLALYLASDIEEDIEEYKYEIFPWALGDTWRLNFSSFLKKRDDLLRRIGYRAIVSRKCCEEVMGFMPKHYAWTRERAESHGGAVRTYAVNKCRSILQREHKLEDEELTMPRGPTELPRPCALCLMNRQPAANPKYASPSLAETIKFMPTPTLYASSVASSSSASNSSSLSSASCSRLLPNSISSSSSGFLRANTGLDGEESNFMINDSASTSGYDTCSTTDANHSSNQLQKHLLFKAAAQQQVDMNNNLFDPCMRDLNNNVNNQNNHHQQQQMYMTGGMMVTSNEILIDNAPRQFDFTGLSG
jgi:hypothetical protein